MTDCDRCIHWSVCSCYNLRDRITQRYDYYCAEFKDCSEWLHVPCKVGDTVILIREEAEKALGKG